MVVGIGKISIYIHECFSLKEKRKVIKSIINRVSNHFNVAIAEVDYHDQYQKSLIGISVVSNDRGFANSKLDKIFNFVEEMMIAELLETSIEIINV